MHLDGEENGVTQVPWNELLTVKGEQQGKSMPLLTVKGEQQGKSMPLFTETGQELAGLLQL
jgi:hypothetical protein